MADPKATRGIPPIPWRRQRQYILDADGVVVATIMGRDTDYDRREMNVDGDLIVRAVNWLEALNHPKLDVVEKKPESKPFYILED